MATVEKKLDHLLRRILKDIRVELDDEFDQNFERQAFFSTAWQRQKNPARASKHILVDSGALRRSLRGRIDGNGVQWESTLPYAALHNSGGKIRVTAKMKKFFWYKYYTTSKGIGRKKNGQRRQDKRSLALSAEAEFWKRMALMKVGDSITIPRRQFLGDAPDIHRAVEDIIDEHLDAFFNQINPLA